MAAVNAVCGLRSAVGGSGAVREAAATQAATGWWTRGREAGGGGGLGAPAGRDGWERAGAEEGGLGIMKDAAALQAPDG
jgi:hypothetical protein